MKGSEGYAYLEGIFKSGGDIEVLADNLQLLRNMMDESGVFCHDRIIKEGSDGIGKVGDRLVEPTEKIIWCTNHYLGMNRHPEVIQATIDATIKYGTGSGTSALSGGRTGLHLEIEEKIKTLLNKESVCLFPTGFSANVGLLSALGKQNDVFISDEQNHASIIDGIKLSKKDKQIFKHNDVEDLRNKLEFTKGKYDNTFVIVETIYSMHGDVCPIKEIVALKEEYNFHLVVDEAHSFGFYGNRGAGYCQEKGVLEAIDFYTGTFSKSCASIGGFVAMKEKFRTLMFGRASAYMFQACFTPANAATIIKSIDLFSNDDTYARELHRKTKKFREGLASIGCNIDPAGTPIITIPIPNMQNLLTLEKALFNKGIFAVSVVYPAVSPTDGKLRFIVTNNHEDDDIEKTIDIFEEVMKENLI